MIYGVFCYLLCAFQLKFTIATSINSFGLLNQEIKLRQKERLK